MDSLWIGREQRSWGNENEWIWGILSVVVYTRINLSLRTIIDGIDMTASQRKLDINKFTIYQIISKLISGKLNIL